MKKILILAALILAALQGQAQPAEVVAKLLRATQRLQLRTAQVDSFVVAITAGSTHRHLPTAKAVYDFFRDSAGAHVIADDTLAVAQRDTLVFSSSGDVAFGVLSDATTTSITGTLNQLGATTGQVLRWTGAQWLPNGINLYDVVTTSMTVGIEYNQVFVDTLSAGISLNLPPCNAANDNVRFEFIKVGPDNYAVTIDPAGSEQFADGATTKTIFSPGTPLACTCQWNGSTGRWLHNSM